MLEDMYHTLLRRLGMKRKVTMSPSLNENVATSKERKSRKFSIYKGLVLALLSGVCYSIASVIVKMMEDMDIGQLAVYRFLGMFVFSTPLAVKCQENLLAPKGMRFPLILCGMLSAINIFLNFMAFRYLPLGEATVIIFSVPAFIAVAARIFLKEPFGIFQSIAVVLTLVGITLTSKLPLKFISNSVTYTTQSLYGVAAAVGSIFFTAARFIILRKIKSIHHSIIMLTHGWVGIIVTLLITATAGGFTLNHCGLEKLLMIIFGVISHIGQTCVIMSLQCEMAAPASIMRGSADIILAFVWQITLFYEIPDAFSVSGAVLVGMSVILVGLNKWATSLPKGASYMKYIGWMSK